MDAKPLYLKGVGHDKIRKIRAFERQRYEHSNGVLIGVAGLLGLVNFCSVFGSWGGFVTVAPTEAEAVAVAVAEAVSVAVAVALGAALAAAVAVSVAVAMTVALTIT